MFDTSEVKGAMNAIISSEILDENELKQKVKEVPKMSGLELSSKVTTVDAYEVKLRILNTKYPY